MSIEEKHNGQDLKDFHRILTREVREPRNRELQVKSS